MKQEGKEDEKEEKEEREEEKRQGAIGREVATPTWNLWDSQSQKKSLRLNKSCQIRMKKVNEGVNSTIMFNIMNFRGSNGSLSRLLLCSFTLMDIFYHCCLLLCSLSLHLNFLPWNIIYFLGLTANIICYSKCNCGESFLTSSCLYSFIDLDPFFKSTTFNKQCFWIINMTVEWDP